MLGREAAVVEGLFRKSSFSVLTSAKQRSSYQIQTDSWPWPCELSLFYFFIYILLGLVLLVE